MLPNGLVLIAGGRGNRSFGMTAELYDPRGGTFTATSNMVAERSYHTATMLPNGLVLIAGGDYFTGGLGAGGSGTTAAAELYDPDAGTFAATGSMTVPREFHTATMLLDGKVLIAGGANQGVVFVSAELYDPAAGTFAATGSMFARREYHTATLLPDGKVLIVGLHWGAELYDLGGTTTTGGTISTGTSAMTLAQACTTVCALASGVPSCSTTTTECEQNCMTTYDNTSAVALDLGRQYTAMMVCIATNLTSVYDYVCAKPNSPLNKWSPGPYSTCEDLICNWNCDDATYGDMDPWVDMRCCFGAP
jgi:hypothetical protein